MAVELISKIKQKNNGDFKLVDLSDVDYDGNGKSAKDKFDETVNGLQTEINANRYTHPTTSGNKHIPSGGSSGQILRWSSDGTAVWSNENNTVYNNATTTSNGLMSSADKTKLDGIDTNANNYTHPTTSGNKHIPSGGSKDQMLVWSADGVAKWENIPLICEDFPTGEDFNLDESDFMLSSVLTEDFDNSDLILENSILKSIIDDLSNRVSLLEDTIKKGE